MLKSGALDYPSGQPPNRLPSPAIPNPLKNSTLQMLLPPDTPQGVGDALGYLQHHLQELTERQHVSENNINSTLAALTAQLQQLTQLVANPPLPPPAVPNTPLPPIPFPPVSPSPAPRLQQRTSQQPCIPELLLPLHTPSPGVVLRRAGKKFFGLSRFSRMVVLPSGPRTSSVRKRTPAFSPYPSGGTLSNNSDSTSSR